MARTWMWGFALLAACATVEDTAWDTAVQADAKGSGSEPETTTDSGYDTGSAAGEELGTRSGRYWPHPQKKEIDGEIKNGSDAYDVDWPNPTPEDANPHSLSKGRELDKSPPRARLESTRSRSPKKRRPGKDRLLLGAPVGQQALRALVLLRRRAMTADELAEEIGEHPAFLAVLDLFHLYGDCFIAP